MKIKNTIVNFHVIKNEGWMESILIMLKSNFQMIGTSKLLSYYYEFQSFENSCHITIDDGDQSVYTHLFPLIKKYQVPVSIYVSPHAIQTGQNFWFQEIKGYDYKQFLTYYMGLKSQKQTFINEKQVSGILKTLPVDEINAIIASYKKKFNIPDKKRLGMDLKQVQELNKSGLVTIGAHTMHHPILKNETNERVAWEIKDSVTQLSDLLNQEICCFAYPNGIPQLDFGTREINLLKEVGIKLAFSTESKNFDHSFDPLSIPRRGVTKGSKHFVHAKLLLGDYWEILKNVLKPNQEKDFRK
ncbi:polysaccharide deacetylase family protein [Mongoliitalea daihaiensis]|uniref:polysaccharide deacetylase family protein n=1 Tax=Mongoliitalea daihaiensis TaxID=2782006 RepID=UPI001F47406E|nr:polysaccharide deacetylase family protein [Mongoliitalea daihaiensis]UJP64868.1 polysaccharide deacetylase family protein [Mongoliitalea daihaiensis]